MVKLVNTPDIEKVPGKVLSLCLPTYNRGWCIKEQIARLMTCSNTILDKMEIIISDNCSDDDTKDIVNDAIAAGFRCRYIRNETNLGMDGNFVSCFQKATGKYVWLLGDDDLILIHQLEKIVNLLDGETEYGLIHIYMKDGMSDPIEYITDVEEMTRKVSYWITFISSNIVNTKYVPQIDFSKYMGTWFTLMPLYITAFQKEKVNIIYNERVFEVAKDFSRNGGYNYFEVFVQNYLSIWKEMLINIPNAKKIFSYLKKDVYQGHIYIFLCKLYFSRNNGYYSKEHGWSLLLQYYGKEWYFWKSLIQYPFLKIKRKLSKALTL